MGLKSVVVVLSVALVGLSSCAPAEDCVVETKSPRSSLVVGAREAGDRIVYEESIKEPGNGPGGSSSLSRMMSVPSGHVITQVSVEDQTPAGQQSAKASLVSGGPGQASFSLTFQSQQGGGIYFDVRVYAKPSDSPALQNQPLAHVVSQQQSQIVIGDQTCAEN